MCITMFHLLVSLINLHVVHCCFPCQWSYSHCLVLICTLVMQYHIFMLQFYHYEYCREGRFVMHFFRFLKTRMM